MSDIRLCNDHERTAVLAIVNAAAEAYRGVIPADRWHEPYMPREELDGEIAAGVVFWGHEQDGRLVGVMGLQSVRDVDLIRHAYVLPESQGRGIGGALLRHLRGLSTRPMLVGTWAAADWAVRFYRAPRLQSWPRPRTRQYCSRPIGASLIGRSRHRWCWRILRWTRVES